MESHLEKKIIGILKKEDIQLKDEALIAHQLAYHTYTMVFNICAIIATHTLIHNKTDAIVTPKSIQTTLEYVTMKCYSGNTKNKKTGGDATVELYNQMRNTEITDHLINGGGISVFTIIFTRITPIKELFPSIYIKEIFDTFKVKASTTSMKQIKHVLKMHLSCLLTDIKKIDGEITTDKIDKVFKLKRHSVFL
jgi:hypothetical protein